MPFLDVPHTLCQSCRQCCHFLSPPEMTPFAGRGELSLLPLAFNPSGEPLRMIKGDCEGLPVWTCSRLEESSASCRSWPDHPLDCRIYPLVFTLDKGVAFIALDTTCPYAGQKPLSWFQEKARDLRDRFWNVWSASQKEALSRQFALDTFPERILLIPLDESTG
ncbi:MAG: Hypothetical protein C75L2_00010034 [Leptospirillum sp. Group II 'C75']|jgi:Fe-S-cluster containining protein|uniref:YkgJ family cysteine cluster protein n=1 Tax=Leptospirillum sp. Group II '5-way CG' TaxID=419541 RepID=B6ALN7_9BACT|nr:YkgJ family cysteine cluster protein [Leptospirillum sp. Group II 'CF-1']AKS22910.1 hypothetical protein ABH19_02805 [Leptospirillum sp. Group II 'CF-1']EDZ39394.1 MAG: Hypothetical protein CGL2_11277029 [Leptospirillum sp. Group II '5-way CG']EIJ76603.1 MAG: Hypothetical protein C75L2_00010034 [Leptospirillum sp. Group II 'C75']